MFYKKFQAKTFFSGKAYNFSRYCTKKLHNNNNYDSVTIYITTICFF